MTKDNNDNNNDNKDIDNMCNNFNIRNFLHCKNMSEEEISRCKFWITANRIIRETGRHNFERAKIPVTYSWNLNMLENWLKDYHDKDLINYLRYSWPLNAQNTEENTNIPKNQTGAIMNETEVDKYIETELKHGTIIGPFKRNPFGKVACFSPINT